MPNTQLRNQLLPLFTAARVGATVCGAPGRYHTSMLIVRYSHGMLCTLPHPGVQRAMRGCLFAGFIFPILAFRLLPFFDCLNVFAP